jgi:ketosteroid isomerase-like protein
MSQENVEVVRVAYEAFAREGIDGFMEHFTDDVEYHVLAGADDLIHGPAHGKEAAVRAWLQDWIDMFDGFWMELTELIDAGGNTVFTAERYGGRARLSGVETDSPNWTVFAIRDGKIAYGHEYETREQALKAAGLRE